MYARLLPHARKKFDEFQFPRLNPGSPSSNFVPANNSKEGAIKNLTSVDRASLSICGGGAAGQSRDRQTSKPSALPERLRAALGAKHDGHEFHENDGDLDFLTVATAYLRGQSDGENLLCFC